MKKSIILAAVAAISMFASCQKEEFVGESAGAGNDLVFTATIDNYATKTTVNTDAGSSDKGKVSWESDDVITISDGTNEAVYKVSSFSGSSATFTKKSGDDLATSDVTYTATYLFGNGTGSITAQTYSATAGDLPMTAESTTTSLTFSVTCGLLKLHLTKTGESIKSIEVSNETNAYTLTCTDAVSIASGADFFIALPAGTYTKFVITDSEGKVCTISGNTGVTITANEIQPLSFATKLSFDYDYLCFTAGADGLQMTLNKEGSPTTNTLEYSTDGSSWTDITIDTEFPGTALNNGDKVYVRAKTDRSVAQGDYDYLYFSATENFEVSGNIMYLVDTEGGDSYKMRDLEFYQLFSECDDSHHLVSAENLILPATTLSTACYYYMFYGCESLTVAPALSATTLAKECYEYMFSGCTSLTTAPALLATELADYCYGDMFYNCSSLTQAPALPATTLAEGCYTYMFCDCTSLQTAPSLPATTLAEKCYYRMFKGCSNLNAVTCLATFDSNATNYTYEWLSGVAASGTFTKASSMTGWTTGVSGIPSGWTTQNFGTGTADVSGTDAGRTSCGWVQLWAGGPKFAEFNVGATISSYGSLSSTADEGGAWEDGTTDETKQLYSTANVGGLYPWHNSEKNARKTTWGNDVTTGTNDVATALWGSKWQEPTSDQLTALRTGVIIPSGDPVAGKSYAGTNTVWTWCDGSSYCYVTGCTLAGYSISGKAGTAYENNSIFLPAAGRFSHYNSTVGSAGSAGRYWSSTPGSGYAGDLWFDDGLGIGTGLFRYGFSVRPVLNEN